MIYAAIENMLKTSKESSMLEKLENIIYNIKEGINLIEEYTMISLKSIR